MKRNLSEANPDPTNEAVTALGPGIGVTLIPLFIAKTINLIPGSDITGVPASLTNAIDSPFLILSTKNINFCLDECSCKETRFLDLILYEDSSFFVTRVSSQAIKLQFFIQPWWRI